MLLDAALGSVAVGVLGAAMLHSPRGEASAVLLVGGTVQLTGVVQASLSWCGGRAEWGEDTSEGLLCQCDADDAQAWAAKIWTATAWLASAWGVLQSEQEVRGGVRWWAVAVLLSVHVVAEACAQVTSARQRKPWWYASKAEWLSRSVEHARVGHAVALARCVSATGWIGATFVCAGGPHLNATWSWVSVGSAGLALMVSICVIRKREIARLRRFGTRSCGPIYMVQHTIPKPDKTSDLAASL